MACDVSGYAVAAAITPGHRPWTLKPPHLVCLSLFYKIIPHNCKILCMACIHRLAKAWKVQETAGRLAVKRQQLHAVTDPEVWTSETHRSQKKNNSTCGETQRLMHTVIQEAMRKNFKGHRSNVHTTISGEWGNRCSAWLPSQGFGTHTHTHADTDIPQQDHMFSGRSMKNEDLITAHWCRLNTSGQTNALCSKMSLVTFRYRKTDVTAYKSQETNKYKC